VLSAIYYYGNQIKEGEMHGAGRLYMRDEKCMDGNTASIWILKK
jgi:hypothetical protein